jgi:phosphatidylglycerophosphate synthase
VAASRPVVRAVVATTAVGLLLSAVTAVLFGRAHEVATPAVSGAAALGVLPALLSAVAVLRRRPPGVTVADLVTLGRAALACACCAIAALVVLGDAPARTWWLVALVVPTLLLDAVDGLVARRTRTETVAGALLDMQVDAGVLVVLCVAVAGFLGPWVLLIGALRYLFVAGTWLRPGWRRTLPRSQFRRTVAAIQGAVLAASLAPPVPVPVARVAVAGALLLLVLSFGTQVIGLERAGRPSRAGSR